MNPSSAKYSARTPGGPPTLLLLLLGEKERLKRVPHAFRLESAVRRTDPCAHLCSAVIQGDSLRRLLLVTSRGGMKDTKILHGVNLGQTPEYDTILRMQYNPFFRLRQQTDGRAKPR